MQQQQIQQQLPQVCGPGNSRSAPRSPAMKSLHFISFTSSVFGISYAVAIAIAARTWIGFGFLFNCIMEFADVCHQLIPSSPANWIDVYCCCSCQLPGPMHRPNHKYIRASLPLPSTLYPFLPFVCIGCDFKTANWICWTSANCNNRTQIDSIWLKYYPKFATNYNFKNHTHTQAQAHLCLLIDIKMRSVCFNIHKSGYIILTTPLMEHFHLWSPLPSCFNSRLSLA